MERTKSLIFLIWFMLLNGNLLFEVDASKSKAKAKANYKYKLIHRHSPELGHHPKSTLGRPINGRERIKQLVHSDYVRYRTFQRRLKRPGRETYEHMNPNHDLRSYMDPMQKKCSNCTLGKKKKKVRFYNPNESRTYRPIPCSSSYCSTELMPFNSLIDCPTPDSACRYDTQYVDGQRVWGTFGNDTITIKMRGSQKVKLENMTIGCSESLISQTFELDGLLGLGCIVQSFTGQAVKKSDKKFCYCLVDHLSPSNLSSYLVFGDGENQLPICKRRSCFSEHGIGAHIIMWDDLDTGTSLTALAAPAYDKVMEGLLPSIGKFKKLRRDWPGQTPGHCFNSTGFKETMVPRLAIHFADGASSSHGEKLCIDEQI
ncbi:hypothetical protein F3Y22_tig00013285pilonHSYRG00216 [Hibiscus syriacus]|uniref:Xylanase inhibitor N-terminal domain-containing protein n=1 Tax=Hibiscus syriacus TaxID=106335 RepID=A0A6A3C1M4_HIBSY|nr:hypothetical protein F3Y22_tig00013285pilonHSYRG00216 [Hibiscus syriacus]